MQTLTHILNHAFLLLPTLHLFFHLTRISNPIVQSSFFPTWQTLPVFSSLPFHVNLHALQHWKVCRKHIGIQVSKLS